MRSSLQRRKTFLPRSCPTTGPTGLWPSFATTRGLHPRLLRSPCRTCRLRSEHSPFDVWLQKFLWMLCNCRLIGCPFHILQIDAKKEQLSAAKRELKSAKADAKVRKDEKSKKWVRAQVCRWPFGGLLGTNPSATFLSCRAVESKKKAVQRIEDQLMKLEVQATDREENKQIALGTSKLNYLDPRISVAWWEPWILSEF